MIYMISFILLGIVIALWIRWRRNLFTVFTKLGIPGPEPSILFGNLKEMVKKNPVVCQDEWIKKYGDVLGYYYGTWPTLLVSNPDLLKQIFVKDFSSFVDRPLDFFAIEGDRPDHPSSKHLINNTGKKWKEVRSLVTPAFTTGKLKQMMPLMKDSVDQMMSKIDSASANGTKDVEVFDIYKSLTMDVIGRAALGIETSVQEIPNHPLKRLMNILLSVDFSSPMNTLFVSFREFKFILNAVRVLLFTLYNKGGNPLNELVQNIADMVQLRKGNAQFRRQDLLQMLIDARGSKEGLSDSSLTATAEISELDAEPTDNRPTKNQIKLTDNDVQANAFLFFTAGFETTSNTLALVTHYLLNNPSVQDQVRQEILDIFGNQDCHDYDKLMMMHYTDRVISETLRICPPVYSFVNRVAAREIQLGKWKIPAGMTVQVPAYSLQHNPENFENPTEFNPDRFLPENRGKNHSVTWVPFGAGPRNCVGMRLALMEIKLVLATLLRRYKLEPSGQTEMGEIELKFNFTFEFPKNGVHCLLVPV